MNASNEGDLANERKREASRWLKIAGQDRKVAQLCMEMAPPTLGIADYHRQQSAEKIV
jgi:hypothetical protein